MKQKSKNAISIIGGADGPTSIFIAGHSKKQPLKIRIKNSIYRYKRKKVEKTIVANPHSLSETVQYAKDKYRSEEHTSELQSHHDLVCRLLLEKSVV